ncbi:AAA family ATPase [Spirosoma gilvum]
MAEQSNTPIDTGWGKDTHSQLIVPTVSTLPGDRERPFVQAHPEMIRAVTKEMEASVTPASELPSSQTGNGSQKPSLSPPDELLTFLLDKENSLREAAANEVIFSPALINRSGTGIIGRGTINVIQGAYGSHKSRLAELFASLMLATSSRNQPQFLDFERVMLERFCVCYIDTERNLKEEFPYAVQSIKRKAGFSLDSPLSEFRFTSIKDIDRKNRLKAIETYLGHVRQQTTLHLFVLLDVVTDCVSSFNDDEQAMKLFDFIGNLCDRHDATFLLVIHQNPGTEKARGHTGTEAANKASTMLQIGFEKTERGDDTEIIKVRFLKLRRGKRPDPIYLQFDKDANGLVIADSTLLGNYLSQRRHKADVEDLAERLSILLSDGPLPKHEVIQKLTVEYSAKDTTIRNRIRAIQESLPLMFNNAGQSVRLGDLIEGRDHFYRLVPEPSE